MVTKINFKDRTIKSYAVRKLTPKECFRLMGVRDDVIATMQSSVRQARERLADCKPVGKGKEGDFAVSVSQQYKMAGNSIVVDVLAAIYEQLWYPKENARQGQMSLLDALYPEDALPPMPVDTNGGEKVFLTTFSGYDSQLMAADALREKHPDFKWTCAGWSDVDKYACQMHNLVFPHFADKALGDITQIDWHAVKESLGGREVDLFTYSSPCQDISQAGKQMGMAEGTGTRSALLWNVADAVEVLMPKYLLQENVAALVSAKFMPDFQLWLKRLESLGYVNKWAKLNAKDYGVPQNRDRVFCVSMRKDAAFDYKFPEPFALDKRLADVLEDNVEERFFLKDKAVEKFLKANDEDDALFMAYDIPPRHEDAMFLKTWLQRAMRGYGLWNQTAAEAQAALTLLMNGEFRLAYARFKEGGALKVGEGFHYEYYDNLNRKECASD